MSDAGAHALRSPPPVWRPEERIWLITSYADATFVLKSDDVEMVEVARELQRLSDRMGGAFPNLRLLLGTSHPFQNAPHHGPVRDWLMDFTVAIQTRWPLRRLEDFAGELLDAAGSTFDAIAALVKPCLGAIVADALGMEADDVFLCGDKSRTLSVIWHRATWPLRELKAMEDIAFELVDLLSARLGDARRGEFAKVAFLCMAGIDTTKGLLGSAIHRLARDHELQDRLRREPALINAFVNEALRFHPPLRRIIGRRAKREVVLGGVRIPAGAFLAVDLECAQRDAAAYREPDRFDIARKGPPTLAFGAGAHVCAGAALARIETRALIERTLRTFVIHPEGESRALNDPDWAGFETLPVRLERLG